MKHLKSTLSIMLLLTLVVVLSACGNSQAGGSGEGEDFPTKSVELIVPYSSGGGTDSVARALADSTQDPLGESIAVVNKTGSGGAVGMSAGANAKPNGYTTTMVTVELTTLPPQNLAQFTPEDFTPIAQVNSDPAAITVSADSDWNSIKDFVEYAKENPGEVQIGNSGTGAIWHLAAAALGNKTGAEFKHVPFEGAKPAVTSLLGGHIDAVSVSPAEVSSQVESGQLKVLGVMSQERLESLKDVPTLKEEGIDLTIGTWRGLAVPKETPEDVVNKLRSAYLEGAKSEEFKEFMEKANYGYTVKDGEAFQERIQSDYTLFKDLIPKIGLGE